MKLKSYRELIVWQKAFTLTIKIYKITEQYPQTEIYGLVAHTRKTAVSVSSNIAEGSARQHLQEYLQFLNIALGSAAELETQILIARELKFLSPSASEEITGILTEVMKILTTLITRLKPRPNT